jgi:hypothetical protein
MQNLKKEMNTKQLLEKFRMEYKLLKIYFFKINI